jgi:TonB family protein
MTMFVPSLHELSGIWMVHALGWTVLYFCWQGVAVGVMLWCALALIGPARARVRYAAACGALGLMVALPAATLWVTGLHDYRIAMAMRQPVEDVAPGLSATAVTAGTVPWRVRVEAALDPAVPWVMLAWFAGAAVFLLRLQVGFLVARRLTRLSVGAVGVPLQAVFDELRKRLGVTRAVRLLQSALVQAPTVIGWLRPVVLLPVSCFTGLSEVQIEAILCHELAHIRRHDYAVSVAQSVVEAVLFYHPAVWWVSRQARRERECCCDDVAVAAGGDVLAYARALSALEARRSFYPEVALGSNGGVLTMRIKRMLGCAESSAASQMAAGLVLALMVGTAAIAIARSAQAEPRRAEGGLTLDGPTVLVQAPAAAVSPYTGLTIRRIDYRGVNSTTITQVQEAFREAGVGLKLETPYDEAKVKHAVAVLKELLSEHGRGAASVVPKVAKLDAGVSIDFSVREGPRGANARAGQDGGAAMVPVSYARVASAHVAGGIAGAVFDPTGAVVARARVTATNSATGEAVATETDSLGRYSFDALAAGSYNIEASVLGFQRWGVEKVLVDGDHSPTLKTTLKVGPDDTKLMVTPSTGPQGTVVPSGLQGPVRVSSGIMSQQLLSKTNPVYPAEAKAAGVQGAVVLQAVLAKDGSVSTLKIVSGPEMLRKSAVDAVQQWKYKPYLLNGQAVDVDTTVTVNYTIGGGGGPAQVLCRPQVIGNQKVSADTVLARMSSRQGGVYDAAAVERDFNSLWGTGYFENVRIEREDAAKCVQLVVYLREKPNVAVGAQEPAAVAGRPVRVSAGVMAGSLISQANPVYPAEAKAARVQGTVVLHAVISKEGRIEDLQVLSGPKELVESALAAVNRWTYKPYLLNGEPTEVETTITVHYSMGGGAEAQPLKVGDGISAPVLTYSVNPEYTPEARADKSAGTVLVSLWVDQTGKPTHVNVEKGVGSSLDEKAVEAVQQYRFKPALRDGKPVVVELTVKVNFQIF